MSDLPLANPRSHSLFAEEWWLDAVAPGGWSEVRVEKGEEVIARLPYVLSRRAGLTTLGAPPLTKALGPWVRRTGAKYANALSADHDALDELIAGLPPFDVFRQAFAPEATNWLPFYWAGFEANVAYTYRLDDLTDVDALWDGMRESVRREIRKAEKRLTVVDDLGIDVFLDLARRTFERQDLASPYRRRLFTRVDDAAAARAARRILFAVDDEARVHAALYVVWDERVAYYLAGGGDPELRTSGASSLLMWEAIRHAARVSMVFDFEGSMLRPVERFFRGFGARQVPYLIVTGRSRRARALGAVRDLGRSIRSRG